MERQVEKETFDEHDGGELLGAGSDRPGELLPGAGEYPHPDCDVQLYEIGGPYSHIHGVCHGHKKVWHLQSGGRAWDELPTLNELDDGYSYVE